MFVTSIRRVTFTCVNRICKSDAHIDHGVKYLSNLEDQIKMLSEDHIDLQKQNSNLIAKNKELSISQDLITSFLKDRLASDEYKEFHKLREKQRQTIPEELKNELLFLRNHCELISPYKKIIENIINDFNNILQKTSYLTSSVKAEIFILDCYIDANNNDDKYVINNELREELATYKKCIDIILDCNLLVSNFKNKHSE